jgi:hypothetical protein
VKFENAEFAISEAVIISFKILVLSQWAPAEPDDPSFSSSTPYAVGQL